MSSACGLWHLELEGTTNDALLGLLRHKTWATLRLIAIASRREGRARHVGVSNVRRPGPRPAPPVEAR